MKPFYHTHCRGSIALVTALSLIVLVGMVGLAIDLGRAYGVKAKLNAAVDAAAIAGARALVVGESDAERVTNAQAAAQKFFAGNFPLDYLGATPTGPNTTAVHDAAGFWTVTVSATADVPTTFLRVLGKDNVPVATMAETIRRDLDLILVLDTSGSLAPPYSPADTPTKLRAAAVSFINKFSEGSDRVGLVSFASGAVLDVPINKTAARGFNRTQVNNAINALPVSGSTASAEGMRRALNEINAVPQAVRSSLRVIVFFSDGAPNDVPATFTWSSGTQIGDLYSETDSGAAPRRIWDYSQRNSPYPNGWDRPGIATLPNNGFNITGVGAIPLRDQTLAGQRSLSGTPYANTRCNVNKAARNMVEYVANTARNQNIAVFSIGLGARLNSLEITFCGYNPTEYGANILKRLANTSDSDTFHPSPQPTGLYAYAEDADELDAAFNAIASAILRLAM